MMAVWSLVWIGLLGVGIWAVIQWVRGGSASPDKPAPHRKTAHELLDDRLARGDIDVTEYQARREALERNTPAAAS